MVILRDNAGNIIGKEASATYTPTRKLRAKAEQGICDRLMGIQREPSTSLGKAELRRAERGLEPIHDDAGQRCNCEDYPACGHQYGMQMG